MRIETTDLAVITGDENVLVLVAAPGDESLACGALIAGSCRRGRPPFVLVLTDGMEGGRRGEAPDRAAQRQYDETRAAAACLGLPHERLLMAGLQAGCVPHAGPAFDTVVRGVSLVMWARDCNVICAPWPGPDGAPDDHATYGIATSVAEATGVGLLACVSGRAGMAATRDADADPAWRLDAAPMLEAKLRAIAAHRSMAAGPAGRGRGDELFLRQAALNPRPRPATSPG